MRRFGLMLGLLAVLPAGAVQLRYGLKVGDELTYRETVNATGSLDLKTAMGDQNLPVEIKAEEERSLKTVSAADNGTFWVESRSLSGKATFTVQGQSEQQQMPGQNLRLRLDPCGKVAETQQLETTQRGAAGIDLRLDALLAAARLAQFPEKDLQPGDSWPTTVPMAGPNGKTYEAKATSKLIGTRQANGLTLAEIETHYEVPIPLSEGKAKFGGMEIPIQLEGKVTGTTTTLWDIARGCSYSADGDGKVNLKLTLVGLSTEPSDANFSLTIATKLVEH